MQANKTIRDHFTFRVVLQGMSHPGKVFPLPGFPGKGSAVIELLGCLMDNEVSFAVIGGTELETVLSRHTSGRLVSSEEADYIIVSSGTTSGRLAGFKRGSLEYPNTGATILYLVEELSEGKGEIVLSGPGVKGTASLRITGLPLSELKQLKEVNSEFPLGVDAIFLDLSGNIACIPRSTQIGVN
ncbi:MAG: phosphonate C-P lyase system protein PhnH [Deltaproteobacteria bacterium]|nr:phosphonate C-P lyase system protein PhnH [Deltaproteobacteria bacterium]